MNSKWRISALEERACTDYFKLIKLDEIIKYYEKELKDLEPNLKNEVYMEVNTPVLNHRKDIILSKINILKAHKEFILYEENMIYKKD